jgi:mRNA m6A methyltransferase catalytic subunit
MLIVTQFRSVDSGFEPICANITKEECLKARRALCSDDVSASSITICDRVHFRPLIRPHTDPALGHCSYLNTCYSEPTYAQSPSIPPLPSHRQQSGFGVQGQSAVALPSGLGAGGRGKEKAPCRYLHFEVDWTESDGSGYFNKQPEMKKKQHKLGLGLGPTGKEVQLVCLGALCPHLSTTAKALCSSRHSG